MRHSLEATYRKYVQGYGFLSFARKFGDKYGKKLINTETKEGTSKYGKKKSDTTKKQGSEFAKTAGKRIVEKSAGATGDLIGNKIADKVTRFITKKWIEVHDQPGETCNTNKQIRFKTSMLISDLCDFSEAYIVVKGIVTVSADERDRDEMNREVKK